MNKHKLRILSALSAVLCFFVISISFFHGSYAYVFGQSPVCRSDFYTGKPESSIPESSIPDSSVPESSVPDSSFPESSPEKPPTGDVDDIMPFMAVLAFSIMMIAAIWISFIMSKRKKEKKTDTKTNAAK